MSKKRKIAVSGKEINLVNGNKVFVGRLADKRFRRYPFIIRFYNAKMKRALAFSVSEEALDALVQLTFEAGIK